MFVLKLFGQVWKDINLKSPGDAESLCQTGCSIQDLCPEGLGKAAKCCGAGTCKACLDPLLECNECKSLWACYMYWQAKGLIPSPISSYFILFHWNSHYFLSCYLFVLLKDWLVLSVKSCNQGPKDVAKAHQPSMISRSLSQDTFAGEHSGFKAGCCEAFIFDLLHKSSHDVFWFLLSWTYSYYICIYR